MANFDELIAKPAIKYVCLLTAWKSGSDPVNFDGPNDLIVLNDCDKTVGDICREVEQEKSLIPWKLKFWNLK